MGIRRAMAEHFSVVAGHYRDVRTTDEEPVRFIRDAPDGPPTRPQRRLTKAFGRRRARFAMPRIATAHA